MLVSVIVSLLIYSSITLPVLFLFIHCLFSFYFIIFCFFFSKQKTSYDMRISDWSSDVCSSDLGAGRRVSRLRLPGRRRHGRPAHRHHRRRVRRRPDRHRGHGLDLPGLCRPDPRDRRRRVVTMLELVFAKYNYWSVIVLMMIGLYVVISRSEEHTSELPSLMRTSYAVFCLQKNTHIHAQWTAYSRSSSS